MNSGTDPIEVLTGQQFIPNPAPIWPSRIVTARVDNLHFDMLEGAKSLP